MNRNNLSEFEIGDLFFTENKAKKIQVPTGAYVHKEHLFEGITPRITVTSQNNGIDGYYSSDDKNYRVFDNFISVSFLGTIFYHPYKASIDMKVHCLKLKDRILNFHLSMFLISEIKKSIENSSYGNQISSTDLPRKKIILPITEKGTPDYDFMEEYIKEREVGKRKKYYDYCEEQREMVEAEYDLIPLADKQWQPFFIVDIFDKIQRGKRLKSADHIKGNVPYVSSSALNNGVSNFVSNNKGVRKFSDCLSLANSGSVGSTFYEPFEFVASDHITHLEAKNFNKYHYLFLATMIRRLSQKYNFAREISDERILREIVLLPVANDNEPDYEYMEKYSRNLLRDKIQSYIDYVTN